METPLRLAGQAALTPFRRSRLQAQIVSQMPSVASVDCRFEYVVSVSEPFDERERTRLLSLLDAQGVQLPGAGADGIGEAPSFFTGPRAGTISPWSSKATDILRLCGLAKVRRVERTIAWQLRSQAGEVLNADDCAAIAGLVHDRMTQQVFAEASALTGLFVQGEPGPCRTISLGQSGETALREANRTLGLALSDAEIAYLADAFRTLGRDPTDVELMMFAQANSEHCRHKIFNAAWTVDGAPSNHSLFGMIRNTFEHHPGEVLSAYKDNSAVTTGWHGRWLVPDPQTGEYAYQPGPVDILMKVETHNHPTAISPYAGAATGAGGEIRDEAATGRGSRSKAGLTGFSVSNLHLPDAPQPWERSGAGSESSAGPDKPDRIASALDIMLEGPIGAASFNNEFGRPALGGYFRTLELRHGANEHVSGYHKPIMIAGGMGNIRRQLVEKKPLPPGTHVVVLGGPAMLIGLGGGAASSVSSGSADADLDFASVQRDNAEMQRRAQEVITSCANLEADNPILSIHDVGAGGLSNAVPEIIHDADSGAEISLRAVPSADHSMSPLEIWCNESQERFVLAIAAGDMERFAAICERERCPWASLGSTRSDPVLTVSDETLGGHPIDLPLSVMFGLPPSMHRTFERQSPALTPLALPDEPITALLERVLRMPSVAGKSFLITIGDRTVGGSVCRDQMVGPYQVPVADCAITITDFVGHSGEAMAMGERSPVALISPAASGRLAVGEAITNLGGADVDALGRIVLSANWMAACASPGEDQALFETVQAVGMELCPALGIAIPVGKDSLSMQTEWQADGEHRKVVSPLSVIISAFAPVGDVRRSITPELRSDAGDTVLLLFDLGHGKCRLGGSALAQSFGQVGDVAPDLDEPARLIHFFAAMSALKAAGLVLAYHDRADGGLLATLLEMAFAGGCGLDVDLESVHESAVQALFNEELGAVIQVRRNDLAEVRTLVSEAGFDARWLLAVGQARPGEQVVIRHGVRSLLDESRLALHRLWSETSHRLQRLRDDPACADEEFDAIGTDRLDLSHTRLTFDPNELERMRAPYVGGNGRSGRPKVAILREQGVNGQLEMAAAFDRAGFTAIDVHMSDLLAGRVSLASFQGFAACGGFSYGDVLGGGGGWAGALRFNQRTADEFQAFFARDQVFGLGVCNGCQMLARLSDLIPGASDWPRFERNRSEQFEARLVLTEVLPSPSLLLDGMAGSVLPTVVSHGEGKATFTDEQAQTRADAQNLLCLRYVHAAGETAKTYPANPNGSPAGITGLTTPDGRFTVMMPHPERIFRTVQHSWHPGGWGEDGPWMRMFDNARAWLA